MRGFTRMRPWPWLVLAVTPVVAAGGPGMPGATVHRAPVVVVPADAWPPTAPLG